MQTLGMYFTVINAACVVVCVAERLWVLAAVNTLAGVLGAWRWFR